MDDSAQSAIKTTTEAKQKNATDIQQVRNISEVFDHPKEKERKRTKKKGGRKPIYSNESIQLNQLNFNKKNNRSSPNARNPRLTKQK